MLTVAIIVIALGCAALGWAVGRSTTGESGAVSATDPNPVVVPDSVPVVAFIGDSYSQGIGASTIGSRWTTLAAASMGWSELNLSEGGTGYTTSYEGKQTDYSTKIAEVAAAKPDIVVISGGRNDYQAGNSTVAGTAAVTLLGMLHSVVPDADLVVVSPVWDSSVPPEEFDEMANGIEMAAVSSGVEFVNIGEPLAAHPEMMAADGLHPNDAGHHAIAERVVGKFR